MARAKKDKITIVITHPDGHLHKGVVIPTGDKIDLRPEQAERLEKNRIGRRIIEARNDLIVDN